MSWAYKDGETDRNQSKRKISSSTKSYLWSQSSLSSRSVYLHSIIQWNCKRNSMMEYKKVMNLMVSWDFAVADTMSFTRTRCRHGKARSWNVLPHPRWPGTGSLCILRVCSRLLLGWIPPSRVAVVIKLNWIELCPLDQWEGKSLELVIISFSILGDLSACNKRTLLLNKLLILSFTMCMFTAILILAVYGGVEGGDGTISFAQAHLYWQSQLTFHICFIFYNYST